jgi:hypothetical protein
MAPHLGERPLMSADLMTQEFDLKRFAPYRETSRHIITWQGGVGVQYALTVVYTGKGNRTVHVVHPNYLRGGSAESYGQFLGSSVRLKDPHAAAVLLSWPSDSKAYRYDELIRMTFRRSTSLRDRVFPEPHWPYFESKIFGARKSPAYWSEVMGTEVWRFTDAELSVALEVVDPGRKLRAHLEAESAEAFAMMHAFLKNVDDLLSEPDPREGHHPED